MPPPDWLGYAAAGMLEQHPTALNGVWAKMRRAAYHQESLTTAIKTYVSLPPYRRVETTVGAVTTVRAEATVQPPEDLALIFGDVVQNLRSALDHLAWAFARTVKDEPLRQTQFPMMPDRPDDFGAEVQVRDVPKAVREVMEELQPHQPEGTVGGMIGRELATLARLSNRDKHRILLLAERVLLPGHVFSNTPAGVESGISFRADRDGQWAEVSHPADPTFGPYTVHFEADVTIAEPGDLPWRPGLEGIATHLWNETNMAIAAFRGQWSLLEGVR